MHLTKREFTKGMAAAAGLAGLGPAVALAAEVSAAEARAIAKEAYIYGFPMVDSYRIQHAYFVDTKNPEYKGRGTSWSISRGSTPPPTPRCRRRIPIRPIRCSAWTFAPSRWC